MSIYKHIYWSKDKGPRKDGWLYAEVHLMVGYNRGSITDFLKMAEELRKTFPEIPDDQIFCGSVINSKSLSGCSIIHWSGYIPPKGNYHQWVQHADGKIEYDLS